MKTNKLLQLIKAKKQTSLWMWFGRVSPLLFLVGAIGLYEIVSTDIKFVFYLSWVIFITVSLVWWGWILKIILQFIEFFGDISETVTEIKDEVGQVTADVKKLTDKSKT